MRAVLDTRFFIAGFASEDELFSKWTKTMLNTLEREVNAGIVPSIVIHELYKVLFQRLGKEVAEIRVNSVLKSYLGVVALDSTIAIEAAKLRCKYAELPTADAIVAATAIRTEADCILTDDHHIRQIKQIKTKWL